MLCGCATGRAPLPTVPSVDLERFMGDWYVMAGMFTPLEKKVHNAVETYRLNPDGTVSTTFRYRKGGFDGKVKSFSPKGFIHDPQSNAEWRMQFLWPFKAAYLIVYLDDDYQKTIIGVPNRNHVWIMSREPDLSDADYQQMLDQVARLGYDVEKVKRVPQQWPTE